MLDKVISGGQIGADIAGLSAAKRLGIATGGTAPKGWMTLKGPQEQALRFYGLVECSEKGYPARTMRNVRNSDATIRIALDFNTPGEACTLRYITKYKKPYFDVRLDPIGYEDYQFTPLSQELAHWIISNGFNVINIAGNAKSYIEPSVEHYLNSVFFRVLDYKMALVPD